MKLTPHEVVPTPLEDFDDLNYYTCTQGENAYELHFFCCVFENEKSLLSKYEDINDVIAFNFQNNLKKKIEKWNIYFFLFVKGSVETLNKVNIEQNKYATRKIVIDEFIGESIVEEQAHIIKEKVLLLEIESSEIKDIEYELPKIENSTKVLLDDLRGKSKKDKKKIASNYLKGVINES